jgi:hypothetical protein
MGLAVALLWIPAGAQPIEDDGAERDESEAVEEGPEESAEEPRTVAAREAFVRGADFVQKAQWGEALAAFERSQRLRPHAVTRFNIGACERALGHYTRARKSLIAALEQHRKQGGDRLSESLVGDVHAFLREIDGAMARVRIALDPPDARIAIDGRPLAVESKTPEELVMIAGLRAAGPPARPPRSDFVVLLDPGNHVISLSHEGFRHVVLNRTFDPGSTTSLPLKLSKLRARIHVDASREEAVVRVNGVDVGLAPVAVQRPAGVYRVAVEKPGFTPYDTEVTVDPGQRLNLHATLSPETLGIHQQWWFWAAAGTLVNAAVTITFLATRPPAERPAPSGGGWDWAIDVR